MVKRIFDKYVCVYTLREQMDLTGASMIEDTIRKEANGDEIKPETHYGVWALELDNICISYDDSLSMISSRKVVDEIEKAGKVLIDARWTRPLESSVEAARLAPSTRRVFVPALAFAVLCREMELRGSLCMQDAYKTVQAITKRFAPYQRVMFYHGKTLQTPTIPIEWTDEERKPT